MKKQIIIAVSVCVIGVLVAVLPLFGKKYITTHDGEYHIIRIVEFLRMLGDGYLTPRWAPDLNSGYGVPLFEYNYPFPNYVGSFVRLFTHDAVYAFQGSQGFGYMLLVFGAFLWLSALFGVVPASIGATAAAFVPYIFVDVYVRGSIGEILAMAFLFLSLYAIEKRKNIVLALFFGLLILSHNILSLLFAPFLILYCIIRDRRMLLGMFGGLGLSAYFWIPALLEEKYVTGLNTVNFRDNFIALYQLLIPSWGTQFSGSGSFGETMSFQLGIAPIVALCLAASIVWKEKEEKIKKLVLYLFVVFFVCILLMFRVSQPVWEFVKPLQLMQYPWRLLSFVVPIAAFMTAYWVNRTKRIWVGILFALFAIVISNSYTRPVLYEPRNESYYLSRPNFTDGTSSMGNSFSTVWSVWKPTRPPADISISDGMLLKKSESYLDRRFNVSMQKTGPVTVNIVYFPGWRATIDMKEAPISYEKDGIIHVLVPSGVHTLRVFMTETTTRRVADYISIASLVFLLAWGILSLKNVCKSR